METVVPAEGTTVSCASRRDDGAPWSLSSSADVRVHDWQPSSHEADLLYAADVYHQGRLAIGVLRDWRAQVRSRPAWSADVVEACRRAFLTWRRCTERARELEHGLCMASLCVGRLELRRSFRMWRAAERCVATAD